MLTRTLAILRKEVREILRDPYTLGVALILPLVLLVLFAYALNTDVRNVRLTVLDLDRTADSRRYVRAFLDSGVYVLGTVGIGLLVSTVTRSQVTAMLLALVLSVMPAMLFSGFLFPIHTMPGPLQAYASTFPARYFIDLSRAIALKGQGLAVIGPGLGFLAGFTAAVMAIGVGRFRRSLT